MFLKFVCRIGFIGFHVFNISFLLDSYITSKITTCLARELIRDPVAVAW